MAQGGNTATATVPTGNSDKAAITEIKPKVYIPYCILSKLINWSFITLPFGEFPFGEAPPPKVPGLGLPIGTPLLKESSLTKIFQNLSTSIANICLVNLLMAVVAPGIAGEMMQVTAMAAKEPTAAIAGIDMVDSG